MVEGSRPLLRRSSTAVTAVGMMSGISDRTGATLAASKLRTCFGSAPRFVMRAGTAFVGWVAGSVGKAPLRTSVKTSFGSTPKFGRPDGLRAAGLVISGRREINAFVGTDARFNSLIRVGTVPKTSVKTSFGSALRSGSSNGI